MRRLAIALLGLPILSGLSGAALAQEPTVKDLARRISKERDDVDTSLYEELARLGGADALGALVATLPKLKQDDTRVALLRSLRYFSVATELHAEAVPFLERTAIDDEGPAPRAAAETLVLFGDAVLEALERVAREALDPAVRGCACDPLVPLLRKLGDAASMQLVLDASTLRRDKDVTYLGIPAREARVYADWTHYEVVRRTLATSDSPERRALLAAKLSDPASTRAWKLLLLELMGELAGPEVNAALATALEDDDASVVLEAIATVRARGGAWEEVEPLLRPLMRHPDVAVRRAAVVQLGHFGVTEKAWQAEVQNLARSRDASLRMGAASALAELRTPEAMEALHVLLIDKLWSVRVEALDQVARLRRLESVPVLIERMEKEKGRFRDDAYTALRMLTGLDQGRLAERWKRWWESEAERFELPPYTEALRTEQERRTREAVGDTRSAKYFGVHVTSERVVFVLDISGSMRLPSGDAPKDPGEVELTQTTRMDVAKRELMTVVRHMPEETLFNIVFFESTVSSLEKKLVRMKRSMRQKALRFVSEQYAVGSTALYPALKLAFDDPVVDTIYLLSDGAPTVGEITDIAEIRAEVRRWNSARHVRLHGVSMGQDSTLLQWLCEDTGGRYLRVD